MPPRYRLNRAALESVGHSKRRKVLSKGNAPPADMWRCIDLGCFEVLDDLSMIA